MATTSLGFNLVALQEGPFFGMCAYKAGCSSVLCRDLSREMGHCDTSGGGGRREVRGQEAVPHLLHLSCWLCTLIPEMLLSRSMCEVSDMPLVCTENCLSGPAHSWQLPSRMKLWALGVFCLLSSRWGYPFAFESLHP